MSAAAVSLITVNLFLGFSGPQVVSLQQLLNRDPDTRIASAGPGSPGAETNYFGLLTKTAVVRFQEKYAGEVLSPSGLTRGNGFVGYYTRNKLNALSIQKTPLVSVVPAITPQIASSTTTTTTISNPNLKNLDKFFAAIDKVAAERGSSAAEIATFKQAVMKEVATTTDMRAAFLRFLQSKSRAAQDDSLAGKTLAILEKAIDKIFMPERAYAQEANIPFGGALLGAFYCVCSENWILTLEPLPPSYAVLLSYEPFSQAYLSYNIPFTEWLLGEYEPGAGFCATYPPYCPGIPSEGMITPTVGSSL